MRRHSALGRTLTALVALGATAAVPLVASVAPPPAGASPSSAVEVPYRDIEVAAPPSWTLWFQGETSCLGSTSDGQVVIGRRPLPTGCTASPATTVRLFSLRTIPAPYASRPTVGLNGVPVILGPHGGSYVTYFVPSVLEAVRARGPDAWTVAGTLRWSPRHQLFGLATLPTPPSNWKAVRFAGLTAKVPAGWQVTRTAYRNQPFCSTDVPGLPQRTVLFDTDRLVSYPPCAWIPPTVGLYLADSGTALRIDSRPSLPPSERSHLSADCLTIGILTACPYGDPALGSMLFLVSGPALHPRLVWLGATAPGSGDVAATVLGSLAPVS